ncbi:MAG: metallophosphoesterase, partial [Planctomycetes bacterium]|nr:metallophosphoesterase [Planctomycetota bacterium]
MYDLIGDIHGHADELTALLKQLGYELSQGTYRHPDRKVIFLGDFIDRGPKIQQVLEIVRSMVDGGHALSVMGNHELNALAFHTEDQASPGEYLRPRSSKNEKQHQATLMQLSRRDMKSYLNWFRTLPFWLELDGLRVIHACWDASAISLISDALQTYGGVTDNFLHAACRNEQELFEPTEILLKGKEGMLPEGINFQDKDGHVRTEIRTRWYLDPEGHTYRTYAFQADEVDCDHELDDSIVSAARPYSADAKPLFLGHYWLSAERPHLLATNVACLDFSVAKGGYL